jgi:hypothetical protein
MKKSVTTLFISAVMLIGTFAWATEKGIEINDPWVREAPPIAPVSAAYMTIINHDAVARTLTQASSPAFKTVEIHEMAVIDGMMKMREQEKLVIAANGQLVLEPGGYHLMLMGRKEGTTLVADKDNVDLTLKFANGEEMMLTVPVRRFTPPQKMGMGK